MKTPNFARENTVKRWLAEACEFRSICILSNVGGTYRGIDATISTSNTGKLPATTHYGQIYSNLDMHLTEHEDHDFFSSITKSAHLYTFGGLWEDIFEEIVA